MLIVRKDPKDFDNLTFLEKKFMISAHYAIFEDLRWHKIRLINHDIIILIPDNIDISYHIKYIRMTSDASIIIVTQNKNIISKVHWNNVIWVDPNASRDFFSGCLSAIQQKRNKFENSHLSFVKTIQTGKFVLENIQQVSLLSKAIANTYDGNQQLRRGIFELLLNSFEHGVYNLGFDLKQKLIQEKKYFSELNKRIRDPAFKNKYVELILHKKDDGIYINIHDPGLGFDHKPYLNFHSSLSDAQTGRGISFVANYCFDQLVYKDNGKSVFAVLKKDKQENLKE